MRARVEATPRPDRLGRGGRPPRRGRSASWRRRGTTAGFPARTASCPTAAHDFGGGAEPRQPRGPRPSRAGSASPTSRGPDGRRTPASSSLRERRRPARVGQDDPRAHVRRRVSRPGAPGPAGRPRRGGARERGRRAGRHDPLARRRRAERRGRSRRRHPGRRPARRALHVPLPRRPGRDVLVPHAPGLVEGGPAGSLRRARHRAAQQAAGRLRPGARRAHVRRDRDARRPRDDVVRKGAVPARRFGSGWSTRTARCGGSP